DFLLYFEEKAKKHYDKWMIVYRHFERFVNGKCSFGDVTIELCNKFREYLLTAKQLRHPKLTITRNSAAGYWSTFRALLKEAYKERLLKENINDFIEDIEYEEVKKNFLTADEVKLLAATPCEKPILKAASLFSILTGLRISDILNCGGRTNAMMPMARWLCSSVFRRRRKNQTTLSVRRCWHCAANGTRGLSSR
ncbi:site-specific integrase, partial [uncultured Duncaniella sp.]|uniref:site-specific integrase n=2 Tax=uncultured Duncaniella sp. TaxID=2768039 RepID=UPI00265E3371